MDFINNERLNADKSRLGAYLNRLDSAKKENDIKVNLQKDPELQSRAIDKACKKCKIVSLDKMLGKIYNDAIPVEGPIVDVDKDICDYIDTKTQGKDTEFYIKEALRRNHSPFLNRMCEAADDMAKKHKARKEEMIKDDPNITLDELENYRYDKQENDNLEAITNDMGFDEVSEIIRQNVKNTIQDEYMRSNNEEKQIKALEDELANDEQIIDQETMESGLSKELNKRRIFSEIHQPSLFEGILKYYTESCSSSSNTDIMYKTICDYTLLSTMKALKLDDSLNNRSRLISMARNYKR